MHPLHYRFKNCSGGLSWEDADRIAKAYPHELSGGQRQRVMIAMALARSPRLLIADEPTTALDAAVQNEVLALIKKIAQTEHMAVLFITHDLISLDQFADHVAVMYKGSIVEFGATKGVLKEPQHPYTKALLKSRANYSKRGYVLEEVEDLLTIEGSTMISKPHQVTKQPKSEVSNHSMLELDQIKKSHVKKTLFKKHETKVLHGITLRLYEGDTLGIIGESGSGKSTLAKIVLKLWDATEGTLKLDQVDYDEVHHFSEQIQLVFQDPFSSLNPKLKIGKAIGEALPKYSRSKVNTLLEEVGLAETDFDKYPHEFSGGQRQRICIARALAKNPKILVLDEAVSALDVSVQARILNLLNSLKRKNKLSFILISHDLNVVSYFCNRMVVLRNGKIVEEGLTEDLVLRPSSEYTKMLLEHSVH